ncbi:GntR family transcriptional regulator [Cellulomonas hominis]
MSSTTVLPAAAAAPPAAETAYQHTKRLVLAGELPGGAMISEGEIAGQLTLSRTPVREAFLRLEAEGWLRLYPKRGALVVPIAPGEAEAVVDARLLLETHAVEVLPSLDPSVRTHLVARLTELVARQRAALDGHDLEAYAREDTEFHLTIVAAGGNALLTGFYVTLRERQQRMVALSMGREIERATAFVTGHRRLVALIADGDTDAFRAELAQHLHEAHLGGRAGAVAGAVAGTAR